MSTAVLQIRKEPYYRRAAVESGLKRLGYTFQSNSSRAPNDERDLLVLWNLKRGAEEQTATLFERRGGTVIVFENGYLQKVDKTHYAMSVHGHNGSGWFPVGDEDRFAKLGFELKPMRSTGQYILVRDQRGVGSIRMHSPAGWGPKMVAKLKAKTDQQVKLMPHPGDKGKLEADLKHIQGASHVHIWSSALGVRALVEGVPVTHHAPNWICEGWAADRGAALRRMAYGQWHHEELATGMPFARLLSSIKEAKWP